MTYMQDLEQQLRSWLDSFAAGDISADSLIAFLKKSHLDSYHNGQNAGARPAPAGDQAAPSGRREWRNKKPSAAGAQFSRTNYQS